MPEERVVDHEVEFFLLLFRSGRPLKVLEGRVVSFLLLVKNVKKNKWGEETQKNGKICVLGAFSGAFLERTVETAPLKTRIL